MIEDEYDHFTDAQDTIWPNVTLELTLGHKRSHWMWFVFPVLEGVGQSSTALFFALRDLDEARGYLDHPVLGPRLADCAGLVLTHPDKTADEIFGPTDAYKLHNCATLFARVPGAPHLFRDILTTFFDGTEAAKTRELLGERTT